MHASTDPGAAVPPKVEIGVAPIGWTNDDLPDLGGDIPFERCIHEMAQAGFTGCEVGTKFPRDPDILRQALEPLGLRVASAWFSLYVTDLDQRQSSIDDFVRHLDFLHAMGAKVAVVSESHRSVQAEPLPLFDRRPIFSDEEWFRLTTGLEEVGSLARDRDMRIVYHHHMGTGVQSAEEVDRLMRETDPETVSLLLDTGHLVYAGGDPVQALLAHGSRIHHIHLKDLRAPVLAAVRDERMSFLDGVRAGVFTVPGDGMIDFGPIFDAITTIDYRGWLVVEAEQDPAKAEPLRYATRARRYIQQAAGL